MLENVKILSFTHYLQGPSAVQAQADLGADVIKMEACKGAYERNWSGCNTYKNGMSMFYMLAGRNQRTMALDLKSQEGKEIVYRLIKTYDVIIENFRPGVMERLGLGYETLKEMNPKIIYCSCTGYGPSGPKVKKPGQDLLVQGMSGFANLTGNGAVPPTPAGTSIIDQHGAILAALGVLAAVYDREQTGRGHKVDASLLGAALDLQIEAASYYLNGAEFTERPQTGLCTRFHGSPYGIYRTKDTYITLGATSYEKLKQLFTPGCLDDFTEEEHMTRRLEFDQVVSNEMRKKTTAEWIQIFEEAGIWYSPVNTYQEVFEDEQVKYNRCVMTLDHPVAGEVRLLNHPNHYDGEPVPLRRMPPVLGEHTREVLREIGYSEAEITAMCENGRIVCG